MTAGLDEAAERLADSREAARRALQPSWDQKSAPKEAFAIDFKSGWHGCGLAMAAIDGFDVADVEWKHEPPYHSVAFKCTFATLKSVQTAVKGTPVCDLRCRRTRAEGGSE